MPSHNKVWDDYGAYLQFGVGTHGNGFSQIVGPYKIQAVGVEITAVLSAKCQQGACRGFGSEVTNFMLERMVDAAVEELGADPIEYRKKNFIAPEEFPYQIPTGNLYDSGQYSLALDEACKLLDYDGWRERQKQMRKVGRHIGIGIASCQEKGVFSATEFWMLNNDPGFALASSPESASVKIDSAGKATITLHSPHRGNSPETVASMVLAEQLTLDPSDIAVTYSDTDKGLPGTGPGGSRYTVMICGAVTGAAGVLKAKLLKVAAALMQTREEHLEFRNGHVGIKNSATEMSIADLAMQLHFFRLSLPDDPDLCSGLDATFTYDPPLTTLPKSKSDFGIFYPIIGHMCHMPVVEVDVETGKISFLDYAAVHDCGTMINPKTLDGHVRGGTAQGIGNTIMERYEYDDQGQILTGSYQDYLIARATDLPQNIKIHHLVTPSPYTEYGVKGAGEGGRMVAPPAVVAAVEDALKPYGVKIDALPIPPSKLRRLIREVQARAASTTGETEDVG